MSRVNSNRLFVIFLTFGQSHRDKGLEWVFLIAKKIFPDYKVMAIVIDNARQNIGLEKLAENTWLSSGDNSLWEFSGWDYGWKLVSAEYRPSPKDMVMFANDTFFRRNYSVGGVSYLDAFDKKNLVDFDAGYGAIGYLDDFPREVELLGIRYISWIRSNIFFLSCELVASLGKLSFPLDNDDIFSDDPELFWKETALISENWRAYISSWLFRRFSPKYPEYRLHWLKATEPNNENIEFFKIKAKCILSEHYLSARLHAANITIQDLNIFPKRFDRHVASYYGKGNE